MTFPTVLANRATLPSWGLAMRPPFTDPESMSSSLPLPLALMVPRVINCEQLAPDPQGAVCRR